jgi:hypothetical protein
MPGTDVYQGQDPANPTVLTGDKIVSFVAEGVLDHASPCIGMAQSGTSRSLDEIITLVASLFECCDLGVHEYSLLSGQLAVPWVRVLMSAYLKLSQDCLHSPRPAVGICVA